VIEDFTNGTINVVMMNAKHYGSGLNLQMATDVIIYHEMAKELEIQVIGRAQRLGRSSSLNVHYLLHENERCNSGSGYEKDDYANLEGNDQEGNNMGGNDLGGDRVDVI
jgi:ERCC4-related helicase